jgi:hypothetical protein
MTTQHAERSPSKAHRWIPCPGSIVLEADRPEVEKEEQTEGTMLHGVGAMLLNGGALSEADGENLTEEQHEAVLAYVDKVREYAALGDALFVERAIGVGHLTGEPGAIGTADAVVILPDELQVHDAKFGRVRVSAERNPQLSLYALGLLDELEALYSFERVRLVIHQPRIGAVDEWVGTIDELRAFAKTVEEAAKRVEQAKQFDDGPLEEFAGAFLQPGNEQCQYCRAKAVCPSLAAHVETAIGAEVEAVAAYQMQPQAPARADLAPAKKAIPLIRLWCDAVDEEVARLMLAGEKVEGFKVVRGKRGARAWEDPEKAEALLKSFRLNADEMYTRKLISPTKAEERAQRTDKGGAVKAGDESRPIKPRQWAKLQALIVQNEGALQVAPESDKRPAVDVRPVAADFANETLAGLVE